MRAFRISIQRKYFIDKKIRDNTYPTATTLAKDYEIECNKKVDPRTIASDISELRQIYKAPIKYDAKNKGYVYTDDGFRLNVLEGESSGIPIASITQPESIPEWQKDLLASFIKEVLPINSRSNKAQKDFSTEHITVLPTKVAEGYGSGVEECFLKALKNGLVLNLDFLSENLTTPRVDFLPLHLICQGNERLFFGKEVSGSKQLVDEFLLINLETVKTAAISYSTNKSKDQNKELLENKKNSLSLVSHENRKNEHKVDNFSYWAQTTGNADIEIIMAGNEKRHIFVFSCYASIQKKERNATYKKVGEFVLNL